MALAVKALGETRANVTWEPGSGGTEAARFAVWREAVVLGTTSERQLVVQGLAPTARSCFRVVAFDGAGRRSDPSEPVCITPPDLTPPSAPVVRASAPRPGAIQLNWDASSDNLGVAAYQVHRGEAVVGKAARLELVETGLLPGREHCYTVRAVDGAGNPSRPSEPACAVTLDVTPPAPPPAVRAQPVNETSITLTWGVPTDDVGVVGYELWRDANLVARPAGTTATIDGFTAATRACFTVVALDKAGNRSGPSEPACATTLDLTPPTSPLQLTARAASDRRIELGWMPASDNVGVTAYQVVRGGKALATVPELQWADEKAAPAVRACYVVHALDAAGNRSKPGNEACATPPDLTPPTIPGSPAARALSFDTVVLGWNPSRDDVGVTAYEVVLKGRKPFRVAKPPATAAGLAPVTEYCLQVRALDAAGNASELTGPSCATTAVAGAPRAIEDLQPMADGGKLTLHWTASSTPGVIYLITVDGGRSLGASHEPSFRVVGLKPGERRCFQVTAQDPAGRESPRSQEICVAGPGGPSAAPAGSR